MLLLCNFNFALEIKLYKLLELSNPHSRLEGDQPSLVLMRILFLCNIFVFGILLNKKINEKIIICYK